MADTPQKSTPPKAAAPAVEVAAEETEAPLERTTAQSFEVGAEFVEDPAAAAAFAEREEAVNKLRVEQGLEAPPEVPAAE